MKTALPALAALLALGAFRLPGFGTIGNRQSGFTIYARTAKGEPLAGVRVFGVYTQTPDVIFDNGAPVTNSRGAAGVEEQSAYIGLAPDGRMAASFGKDPLIFGATGTLKLQLKIGTGAPLAGRTIKLLPKKDSSPLKPYGQPGITLFMDQPALVSRLSAQTNASGWVQFSNLPLGVSFGVSTALQHLKDGGQTSMTFAGTVKAGESARLVVSHQCSVSGHVRSSDGRPVARAIVSFAYTEYWVGSLDNAPTVIGTARTDVRGGYRISKLPNWELEVTVNRHRYDGKDLVQSVRNGDGKWDTTNRVTVLPGRSICDIRVKRGS